MSEAMTADARDVIARKPREILIDEIARGRMNRSGPSEIADAALAALDAAGKVVVPSEPTEEMVAAAWVARSALDEAPTPGATFALIYRAMLAARPGQ